MSYRRLKRGFLPGLLPGLLLSGQLLAAASQPVYALPATDWTAPRSAQSVLALAPVAAAVRDWQAAPAGRLVIRYPAGEAGAAWAEELAGWLVALGVPRAHLAVQPGAPPGRLLLGAVAMNVK